MTIRLSEYEEDAYRLFCERHRKCKHNRLKRYFYYNKLNFGCSIILTPTGIGFGKDAKCNVCGETEDITDYENW